MKSDLPLGTPLRGPVELTNCDREPIHIPAGIQTFGCLIVVRLSDQLILSASENCGEWFSNTAVPVAGNSIADSSDELRQLVETVVGEEDGKRVRRIVKFEHGDAFVATAHRVGENAFLELEPPDDDNRYPTGSLVEVLFQDIDKQDLESIYQTTVDNVRSFTGFDRVMLYRFHEDDHGSVIAESKSDDQEPFLGLHYPAGDIPQAARRLYELSWIRSVADSHEAAIPLNPAMIPSSPNTSEASPIDLSYSNLRAISPIHLEYLRNMGVRASMSISILSGGKLWGLIACHHRERRVLPPRARDACELAGSLLSTYLSSRRQQQLLQRQVEVSEMLSANVAKLASSENLDSALARSSSWIADLFDAQGVIWSRGGERVYWGETPSERQTNEILEAIDQQSSGSIFFTDRVTQWRPESVSFADRLPGLMVLRLGKRFGGTLLLLRQPYSNTISWAGDPSKSEVDESGRITPRKSFETYIETVQDRSKAWSQSDRETAELLLNSLNIMIVEQASKIQEINVQLQRLNSDLDAFAYAASHDLKEPLRGINHHIFMLQQATELTGPTFERGMDSLKRLVGRMSELLDGLLRFSRAGRQELNWETFSLKEVVNQAQDVAFSGLSPSDVEIQIVKDGKINGDFACVREILSNLFTNSVKYNDSENKRIEVGCIAVEKTPLGRNTDFGHNVFYVRDNGIGIPQEYQQRVFNIFTRLHEPNHFGGGSGAGLTIVRRMVERHDGKIAVESDGQSGTTFYLGWEPT